MEIEETRQGGRPRKAW